MPEVSIVLPVFNGSTTIARAVRSILDQTLRDIELIVVDDGSTDETAALVRAFRDPRLKLISCDHRSVSDATNAGTKAATAPVIARMDADDFSQPERLEKQLKLLHRHQLDVVGCKVRILSETGEAAPGMQRYQRWINEETLTGEQIVALRFVELPIVNPTILAKRAYFKMGFRDGDLPEDYDLMLRAADAGMRFGKVPEVLFDWTDRPNRLTRTDSRYTADAFTKCRQQHLLAGPLQNIGRVDLWGVGKTGKPWLRWMQAQGITVRLAFDINQRKVGTQIHGVPVVDYAEMPAADGTPLVIAVGAAGARALILSKICTRGYIPGKDAWFVA